MKEEEGEEEEVVVVEVSQGAGLLPGCSRCSHGVVVRWATSGECQGVICRRSETLNCGTLQ